MSIQEISDASERLTPTRSVALDLAAQYPESFAYRMKNLFLGKSLVTCLLYTSDAADDYSV